MTTIAPAGPMAAPVLAAIHAEAFDEAWSADDIQVLLESPGAFALAAMLDDEPAGFVLCRIAADEAEILTLAVRRALRRRGVAAALVAHARERVLGCKATAIFLEVAADNLAAQALYRAHGFITAGLRPRYYLRPTGAVDALIMRLDLNR